MGRSDKRKATTMKRNDIIQTATTKELTKELRAAGTISRQARSEVALKFMKMGYLVEPSKKYGKDVWTVWEKTGK